MSKAPPSGPSKQPRVSLHHWILTDLENQILSGAWPPGSQIPFEQDLAKQYGCSRMTVNKVMTKIAAAGLIERRRKAGSFVSRPQHASAVLEIVDIRLEVESLGLAYTFEVLRRARPTRTKRRKSVLDLEGSIDTLEISCLHWAGQKPFCFEQRAINLAAVPEAGEQDFKTISPGAWLVARVPWTAAEHKIRATAADATAAATLMIAPGAPCLQIDRRTWESGVPITAVRLLYPSAQKELIARFKPSLS